MQSDIGPTMIYGNTLCDEGIEIYEWHGCNPVIGTNQNSAAIFD